MLPIPSEPASIPRARNKRSDGTPRALDTRLASTPSRSNTPAIRIADSIVTTSGPLIALGGVATTARQRTFNAASEEHAQLPIEPDA